jgi:hypothetical protein
MPGLTLTISPTSEQHALILDEVRARIRFSKDRLTGQHDKWRKDEETAVAYIKETDINAIKRRAREDGKPQYTTISVPYSYGILMASHTYWTTVFLGRSPVFQYQGRHGESVQQIQALEALMDYQLQVGGQLVPLYLWLMDMGKYGIGVLGNFWEERDEIISQISEVPKTFAGIELPGKTVKRRTTIKVPGYHGNRLYNIRPLDWFPDPRVPLHKFQDGEFVGVYNEIGWNNVLRRAESGLYMNLDKLEANQTTISDREQGSNAVVLPDDLGGANLEGFIDTGRAIEVAKVYECYIELIPTKWKLGKSDLPEKWVFTVTSDFKTVIGAQPLGALHNKFPMQVIELEPEAYALANRGIPDILRPVQETIDWLINTHFFNIRKALNNQFVVDPSRVIMKDVEDPLPGNIIRLKPAAYGTDPSMAIKQLSVVDLTGTHMNDIKAMIDVGQRAIGVNDQILGVLASTGRKTATEVRGASAFGINRLKTISEYASAMGFHPLSAQMVQNSQQYYDLDRKFRIVGDLAQEAGEQFMQVSPETIAGFYDFVPVDGTLPADRFAQANLWKELLSQMRNYPQVAEQYDIARIFAWVAQLAGLKNINQFKVQMGQDELLAREAERGNVVPLGGAETNLNEPRQIPNIGPTG